MDTYSPSPLLDRGRLYFLWWINKQIKRFLLLQRCKTEPHLIRYFKWRAAGASASVAWEMATNAAFEDAIIPESGREFIARHRRLRQLRVARGCDKWTIDPWNPEGLLVRR